MHGYAIALATALSLVAAPVVAHPKLLSATPAPNAAVKPTGTLRLNFSETLLPKFSGAEVTMTGMPGMTSHAPTRIPATVTADGKSLAVRFARPLARGTYRVDWHVVSADTHRVKGGYVFKVG